jgi:hypothetical protein
MKSNKMSIPNKNSFTSDPRVWLIATALLFLLLVFIRAYTG